MVKALFLVLLLLAPLSAYADSQFLSLPCPDTHLYSCSRGKCSCQPKSVSSDVFFVAKNIPTIDHLKGSGGTSAFKCVPELNQCGCNGVLDCFNMFLSLKVKCESFDCGGFGCTCHFPNNIPN